MSYEYIASGLSFIWCNKFTAESQPELVRLIRDFTDRVVAAHHNHKYGVLFNAYTEKHTVEEVNSIFKGYSIQADSGGLQMMTLGHGDITEEAKDKVYRTQAKYATIGMSFDQIPVTTLSDKQGFLNAEMRYFNPAIFDECAIESGKNLHRQIDVYREEGSTCKPLLIVQGNGLDWYRRWADLVLQQIPQDKWQYIAGVSSSSFALGNGLREDVERVFSFSQLDVPDTMKKQCHLLGFGSAHRMIPVVQFKRSGLYDDSILFSYDSTKHTGGISRGQYQNEGSIAQLRRHKDKMYYDTIARMDDFFENILGFEFNEQDFFDTLISPAAVWAEKYGQSGRILERNLIRYGFLMYSVHTTMNMVKHMEKNEEYLTKVRKSDSHVFMPLSKVKTLADYNHWKNHVSRHLVSKKVKTMSEHTSLHDFFE